VSVVPEGSVIKHDYVAFRIENRGSSVKKLLRTRAAEGDRDLIVVTDEGYELDPDITEVEWRTVIGVLVGKLQAFYHDAEKRPCAHELDQSTAGDHE
jgi:hypothetical protein